MTSLSKLRGAIRAAHLADERVILSALTAEADLSPALRERISSRAEQQIKDIRDDDQPGLMEVFLAEYGLSTNEGVALMCLAEALLRVPDSATIDDLIEDKIAPSAWGQHLGKSSSSLVNASTWALMLTGKVLDDKAEGIAGVLRAAVKRLGEPVIRTAVKHALKEMGNQFVLGETIQAAIKRGMSQEENGCTYSYDMLGEAALTMADADQFYASYKSSIETLATRSGSADIAENPGISIKLSALHPRYEVGQRDRVMTELVERTLALALVARDANIGLNIDAEEADRLDLSLDVIEAVLSDERLAGWDGFGIVVQAYGKRASAVINWIYALATTLDRKLMVRLVKGAYWDTEIKRSQVEGLSDFPVFIHKSATDVSYICCAKKLLKYADRIYPQFATHNAHSVSAILEIADAGTPFEFQRLHGMGEVLHRQVMERQNTRCRIYAPVGAHRDLLAYLVRRLLENGANSSFVNQILDPQVPAGDIAADPFAASEEERAAYIRKPADLYAPERTNSRGFDLHNTDDLALIDTARNPFANGQWNATPLIATEFTGASPKSVLNPADPSDCLGNVTHATAEDVASALDVARDWAAEPGANRAKILTRAADLYEANFGELFAALTREAGKTPMDAISELREAVDFLRYYAAQINNLEGRSARGLLACISPWNFPLAIFTGQISAALAAGNGVLAKPADPTPIIATIAVKLLHLAGVPRNVLQLLPGRGSVVGARLTSDARIKGMCFTGSTSTAQTVNKSMAENIDPTAILIAETGGLNAMIVDSTALPEQAVKDIVSSAFQSAGQRCSALRILYLQEDIAPEFLAMLFGAMDELVVAKPWDYSTDVGPIITETARAEISAYVKAAKQDGRLLKQIDAPKVGNFVGPAVIKVDGIGDLETETFGPVLHIATFSAEQIEKITDDLNAKGFGLTFGLHTRIDNRVKQITTQLNVGNMYINRNQIGAIVGSQPFGGEGLSGTGPKAGGPNYVPRFTISDLARNMASHPINPVTSEPIDVSKVQNALDALEPPSRQPLATYDLPGPTGESNRLSLFPRGTVLCLGPTAEAARLQVHIAQVSGCSALAVAPEVSAGAGLSGFLRRADLRTLRNFDAVALWSAKDDLRAVRKALAERDGALLPLLDGTDMAERCTLERHVCIDTTAAGGNAALLAQSG